MQVLPHLYFTMLDQMSQRTCALSSMQVLPHLYFTILDQMSQRTCALSSMQVLPHLYFTILDQMSQRTCALSSMQVLPHLSGNLASTILQGAVLLAKCSIWCYDGCVYISKNLPCTDTIIALPSNHKESTARILAVSQFSAVQVFPRLSGGLSSTSLQGAVLLANHSIWCYYGRVHISIPLCTATVAGSEYITWNSPHTFWHAGSPSAV
jgi:hypothetical protein